MASVADRAFGVGRAISEDLKSAGYTVVINCASNDEAVAKYKSDTEIPNYTFLISDFDECAALIAQIKKGLAPLKSW